MPARRGRMRDPAGAGQRRAGRRRRSASGPTLAPRAGRDARRRRVAAAKRATLALEAQRLHRARRPGRAGWPGRRCGAAAGRWAAAARGPPGAFDQCSTSQPRLRAMAARRVSGLTATGKPTASSIGRSLTWSRRRRRTPPRSRPSAAAVVDQRPGPGSRRWAARRRARRCRCRRRRRVISAATMSSNSGRSGSTTKSRAPVMSTVRWPSARCSRTRRMAGGERLGEDQLG